MISRIRFIYVTIPVAVSAFAAYGPVYLLLFNIVLLPIFFRRKEDYLTPILSVFAAIFSFSLYFQYTSQYYWNQVLQPSLSAGQIMQKLMELDLKVLQKHQLVIRFMQFIQFSNEQEKASFSELNLPSIQFTLSGNFREPDIPSHNYSFDMEKYMRMYGASGIFESEILLNAEVKSNYLTRLSEQRRKVKQHIESTFPESLITEAEALLIGDRSGMDEQEATIYRRLGITHLFAISGLHVGLLAFMLRELLLRCNLRRETVDVLIIVLLPLYAVIAGGAPSVWRAVSVTVLVLLTSRGGMKIRLDNALALSALAFILYQPFVLFQPGFQLSYIAAFSLVLSSKILAKGKSLIHLSFLVTSISQLSLYPILLVHFYELSLSSFFVNVVYVPLYSVVILPANILLLVATWIYSPIAQIMFFIYVPFRGFVASLSIWLSSLPYQLWTPGKLSAWEAVFAAAGVLYFFAKYEEGALLHRCLLVCSNPCANYPFAPLYGWLSEGDIP